MRLTVVFTDGGEAVYEMQDGQTVEVRSQHGVDWSFAVTGCESFRWERGSTVAAQDVPSARAIGDDQGDVPSFQADDGDAAGDPSNREPASSRWTEIA